MKLIHEIVTNLVPTDALKDITVIECATFVTGPYAAALLADLGARVIKVESPPDGDPYRYFAPDPFFSPNFAHLNRNKESLVLDLKTKKGKEICLSLIKKADVFVENFRPGTAERLGLGYDLLRALNLKLIYCSISAFGQSGPYADKPGFDTLGQAMSGLLSVLTDLEQPKVMGIALSDYTTGLSAGYGILGALMGRQRTGEGSKVETSLLQATLSFIGETAAGYLRTSEIPDRLARVKNAHAFAFLAKDELPLVVHCSVPEKFWSAFLKAIDRLDLAQNDRFRTREARRKHYPELERALEPTFATRTRSEWLTRLEENDVPAAPLYNVAEVLGDPQVKHLGLVEEVEHPKAGKLGFVGSPVSYTNISKQKATPPPLLGEQTAAILNELGYGQAEIKKLEKQGVAKMVQS
ncbi:MAG TPA: CaiB/BaiF CoA-transferase family protein [Candidatus Binatia bacterium]|jgi:crotonobetainyl-CoA:carnitine CoA-transferase CaiB-like acyl-CoA transferase|nr:CaiB/BaiF CoA-transferase family protein [Candidatus Binatia bacterium]